MGLTEDQKQVKALLTETITLLCKNGLHFRSEFSIDGLIGITLDQDNVFLVSIKETIKCDTSQNNEPVHINQAKTESLSRMSPSRSRGKKYTRTNDAGSLDKAAAMSQARSNVPPISVEDGSFTTHSEMPDVKLEFSTADAQDHSQSRFEKQSVSDELFSVAATASRTQDASRNNSDSNVHNDTAVSRHCESLEPSRKRLHTGENKKTNESPSEDDRTLEFRNEAIPGSRVCKTEPLDVVEIPDDEMESSLNSDNSYLMYMSMYGGGVDGGAVSTDVAYSTQYNLSQMNQHSGVAGCSSWNATQRNSGLFSNQDKSKMAGVLPRASSRDHRWKRHQFGKDYQCRDCGKVLSCYTSLKLHQLNIHNGLFQFSCPLCGKGLRRERDLRGHMASRHNMQKEFKCNVCGKEFGYSYTLKDHLLRIHSIVQPQYAVLPERTSSSN